MVGVDADAVVLEVKRKLAELDVLQLVLVQVRPTPQPGVDHVGEAFAPSHLLEKRGRELGERAMGKSSIEPGPQPLLNLNQAARPAATQYSVVYLKKENQVSSP